MRKAKTLYLYAAPFVVAGAAGVMLASKLGLGFGDIHYWSLLALMALCAAIGVDFGVELGKQRAKRTQWRAILRRIEQNHQHTASDTTWIPDKKPDRQGTAD